MILLFGDRVWEDVIADPDWEQPDLSMIETNHTMREALTDFIKEGLGNKTHYVDKCVPDFPVWGKRLIVDNGWHPTLARDNVDLVTTPIKRIVPEGIENADRQHHLSGGMPDSLSDAVHDCDAGQEY